MNAQVGQRFRELVALLRRIHCAGSEIDQNALGIQALGSELLLLLLEARTRNYARSLQRYGESRSLRSAEDFIRENSHVEMTLGELCRSVGVNSRTLQHWFQREFGCGPMQYLRKIRIEHVRSNLLRPRIGTSVTSEAARWGFLHFGRFSAEYESCFGELPSQTLRRSKQSSEL
jgi:AraC family ethanolamine operon transcriptional activator